MFENVGSKLQTITTGIFYLCAGVYAVAGVISFFVALANEEELASFVPLLIVGIAIIFQYLITLALVGLGKIVEKAEREMQRYSAHKDITADGRETEEPIKIQINSEISDFSQDFLFSLPVEKRRELMMYISSHKLGQITDEIFEREKNRILSYKE